MTAALAALFVDPLPIGGISKLLLSLPLCLSIAIVYKTLRCANFRRVPIAAFVLWLTILLGMFAVGVAVWVLTIFLP